MHFSFAAHNWPHSILALLKTNFDNDCVIVKYAICDAYLMWLRLLLTLILLVRCSTPAK